MNKQDLQATWNSDSSTHWSTSQKNIDKSVDQRRKQLNVLYEDKMKDIFLNRAPFSKPYVNRRFYSHQQSYWNCTAKAQKKERFRESGICVWFLILFCILLLNIKNVHATWSYNTRNLTGFWDTVYTLYLHCCTASFRVSHAIGAWISYTLGICQGAYVHNCMCVHNVDVSQI